jgi:hypothetical protein
MNGVSRLLKPAALLGLLTALGLAGYGAGKAGATCYTGCQSNWGYIYDTNYSITIKNIAPFPVLLDFDGASNPTPLCTGGSNPLMRDYKNGGTPQCSMGPSAYKSTLSTFGTRDGTITVSGCNTCS